MSHFPLKTHERHYCLSPSEIGQPEHVNGTLLVDVIRDFVALIKEDEALETFYRTAMSPPPRHLFVTVSGLEQRAQQAGHLP